MADEWASKPIDPDRLRGREDEPPMVVNDYLLEEARRECQDRLRPYLSDLVGGEGVTEVVFFDGMAALDSATDVRRVLDGLLASCAYYLKYADDADRPGRGRVPGNRRDFYERRITNLVKGFAPLVRRAIDQSELVYSAATRTVLDDSPLWVI